MVGIGIEGPSGQESQMSIFFTSRWKVYCLLKLQEHKRLKSMSEEKNTEGGPAKKIKVDHASEQSPKESPSRSIPTVQLRGGQKMPIFGLGCWAMPEGKHCESAIDTALKLGYTHIDTATMYGNEGIVGTSLAKLPASTRDHVWVTTKLQPEDHRKEKTREALERSLKKLGKKSVNLYLIHTPQGGKVLETWKTMLELKSEGKARAVGVSNFGSAQLEEIKKAGLEMP
eukprot:g47724.t1